MDKIEAVIFDMDGLLIDSETISFKCFQTVFSYYGYEISKEYYINKLKLRMIKKLYNHWRTLV